MVLPLGFEPRSSSNLEAMPGYKPGALPIELREYMVPEAGVEPVSFLRRRGILSPFPVPFGYSGMFVLLRVTLLFYCIEKAAVKPPSLL